MRTKKEILELVEQEDVEFIRLQFTDMFGNLKNMSVAANQLANVLDKQFMFDGSAMFGAYGEGEDDLYLEPDLDTFAILPWRPQPGKVARLLCNVHKADGSCYEISPRCILNRIVKEYQEMGYTFSVDPECEFFLFHVDENGIPTTITHEQA
ncbi:MAG: glutamine synthetase beta-grasp domain-containing protein, partial [Lachnospiraceae bacterium]|nr:glutamine synthetase beta-grasp domain-containing protein [Lachnospiraceae bacterium]